MDNGVFVRKKSDPRILDWGLRGLVLMAIGGCGPKESPPPLDKQPEVGEAALTEEVDSQRDMRAEAGQRGERRARGKADEEKDGRSPRRDRLRKWTSQHLYMNLTLEHIKPSEEQLTKLADMNWRHFAELQKKKADRPSLDEALLKMLSTGILDTKAFESDRTWIAQHNALRVAQYRERMTTLHETLTGKQRTKLVGWVEAKQKKRYAEEEKRLTSEGKTQRPVGCGGQGNRFTRRFMTGSEFTKEQKTKLAKLRTELDRENPSVEEVKGHHEAQRIFDLIVRKAFVRRRFDASGLKPPTMAYADPGVVSQCNQRELQALLEMLSAAQRRDATVKFQKHMARRRGDDPNASAVDGGTI